MNRIGTADPATRPSLFTLLKYGVFSNPVTLTVTAPFSRTVVFTASVDHDAVVRYLFSVFAAGEDPLQASPLTTLDLSKPAVVNGECIVDVITDVRVDDDGFGHGAGRYGVLRDRQCDGAEQARQFPSHTAHR